MVAGTMGGEQKRTPLIEMRAISKAFGAIQAVDGMSLTIHAGEVVGLVGDNAAGKSTLMKILAGAETADHGQIYLAGQAITVLSPLDAQRQGIAMVYQDLTLADNLDVASNVFLGRELIRRVGPLRILDRRQMQRRTAVLLLQLAIAITDVRQRVGTLSGGQRQAVAIARALAFDARCVILDEPTAALAPAAAQHVLALVGQLRARDIGVVFISHRADELRRVADRIVTMQRGRLCVE